MSAAPSLDITHVVFPKDPTSCAFTGVAIARIKLPPKDPRRSERCIFSQLDLDDVDDIGGIVYSKTPDGAGPLVWKFLCTDSFSDEGAHIFDIDYLKIWIDQKGAEYLHCPLCRSGVTEERKEHVEESEIDTMEQMIEKRDACGDDLPMRLFQEQLIFQKACAEKWDRERNLTRAMANESALKHTMEHWVKVKKIDEFRPKILDGLKVAIGKDMCHIVKIILSYAGYSRRVVGSGPRNKELVDLITECCEQQAIDTLNEILKEHDKTELEFEIRPRCLHAAIKTQNVPLIMMTLDFLVKRERRFVADECFREAIKRDVIDAAQRILEYRWHSPTDDDYKLAESCDNSVNVWLQARRKPLIRADSETALDWDSWDTEAAGAEGGDGDDDDWDDDDDGF